jgi:hypothetical protein
MEAGEVEDVIDGRVNLSPATLVRIQRVPETWDDDGEPPPGLPRSSAPSSGAGDACRSTISTRRPTDDGALAPGPVRPALPGSGCRASCSQLAKHKPPRLRGVALSRHGGLAVQTVSRAPLDRRRRGPVGTPLSDRRSRSAARCARSSLLLVAQGDARRRWMGLDQLSSAARPVPSGPLLG